MSIYRKDISEMLSSITKYKIACIGAGKMLTALISGIINQGYDPKLITATRRDKTALQHLSDQFSIHTSVNNCHAVSQADVVILGIKPTHIAEVLPELVQLCQNKLIISVMAGVSTGNIKSQLTSVSGGASDSLPVIRAMPNLPCQIARGITGLFASVQVNAAQKNWVEQVFTALGKVLWLQDEEKMHPLTVISGSGPAYFFLLQEYLINFAREQGFSQQEADMLVRQTALGTGSMSEQSGYSVEVLRSMITSPGGVTEKVIKTLEAEGSEQLWQKALVDGCLHSKKLLP